MYQKTSRGGFFGTFWGLCRGDFLLHFGRFFWYILGGFWYLFWGGLWYIFGGLWYNQGGFAVQLGGLCYNSGGFKYTSGIFSTFCRVRFWIFFLIPSGSEWGVGAQAGC